jgi:predicted DCC family thiol-disulfide oxidoreductase YuxK
MKNENKVIFFDGVCGLCNGFVDFILRVDTKSLFKFSPLQSEYARSCLKANYTSDLKTVVLLKEDRIFTKSAAVFEVFNSLGGGWKVISIFKFLPSNFTNYFYDIIASNRYNIFGKKETCRIPTPDERSRFIL